MRRASLVAFALTLAVLPSAKLAITAWPAQFRTAQQAAVFAWPLLALWIALAVAGYALSLKTGFPEAWDARVPIFARTLLPLAAGLLLGAISCSADAITHWTAIVAARMHLDSIHLPLPWSPLIYTAGGVFTDIVLRLFPLPLLLLPFRGSNKAYWPIAAVLSGVEGLSSFSLGPALGAYLFFENWLVNFTQAFFFRRAGFVACVLVRFSYYMVWHVLWPNV